MSSTKPGLCGGHLGTAVARFVVAIGISFLVLSGLATRTTATGAPSSLEMQFRAPPPAARPWVYWFWMNGNISREGITADLEAMQRVGIGGCLIMHVKLGDIGADKLGNMPPEGPVAFMSDAYRGLVRHAIAEADRLGLQIDLNDADGFTGSGGPWVPVEKSMKKLVSTETAVSGTGEPIDLVLPQPETVLGFYRDLSVFAHPRQPSLGEQMRAAGAVIRDGAGTDHTAALTDGRREPFAALHPARASVRLQVTVSFAAPFAADTMVLQCADLGKGGPRILVEVSDDGRAFRPLGTMTMSWYPTARSNTVRFDACRARHFRLSFQSPPGRPFDLGELGLGRSDLVHAWEPKAGFTRFGQWGAGAPLFHERKLVVKDGEARTDPVDDGGPVALRPEQVLPLAGAMQSDGRLRWTAPPGEWTIVRLGYTTTGVKNHPASKGGYGLECDKLHPSGIDAAFEGMLRRLIEDSRGAVGRSLTHAHVDSWEVGVQNWTEDLPETFRRLNGYDLTPFLPLLAGGRIVATAETSERFLWDFRRTLVTMMGDHYLGRMHELCRQHGLQFSSEAAGRQQFLHQPLDLLARSDLPMGEFWPHEGSPRVDCKAAASIACLYDRPMAGAEAFTGAGDFADWRDHPYRLKAIGDEAFCAGINHFVIHYAVHQAYPDFRPGFAMGPWGLHFDRMNTWWEQGRAWLTYLARCQHLLRQGRLVADVLAFPGESVPQAFGRRGEFGTELPPGYDFVGCDRATLLERLTVRDGRLNLPSGQSFRYLMLADGRTMTLEVARRVRALVEAGATVIGARPERSPSLRGFPAADAEVRRCGEITPGRGRWISDRSFAEIARADGLPPDFAQRPTAGDAKLGWIHRQANGIDLYFVANPEDRPIDFEAEFRVGPLRPELWDPIDGSITLPAAYDREGSVTRVPLRLQPRGSVFVVFRHPFESDRLVRVLRDGAPTTPEIFTRSPATPRVLQGQLTIGGAFELFSADGRRRMFTVDPLPPFRQLDGPWAIEFPPGGPTPPQVTVERLASWTEHPDFNVQHFSGTARYRLSFALEPAALGTHRDWWLDLGDVRVIAEVRLNGRDLGILWKPPFRVAIDSALRAGENHLEVRVTNLWPNRLIGDEHFPDDASWEGKYLKAWPEWFLERRSRPEPRRKTFSVVKHFSKDSPLLLSGLLGPVRLLPVAIRVVNTDD
jgi:hypothetical protein